MKILGAEQIREVDNTSIALESIRSVDLMERAALACMRKLMKHFFESETRFCIFCGMGNNGGDGLAIGRLLFERGFDVQIALIRHSEKFSADAQINYELLKTRIPDRITDVNTTEDLNVFRMEAAVAIDAVFGSGLSRPADGLAGEAIRFMNQHFNTIVSIDVPSGLFIDSDSSDNQYITQSTLTLSLQLPKLAFMLPQNQPFVNRFALVDIGLHPDALAAARSAFHYIVAEDLKPLLKRRYKFDHKGRFGHALLMAGSKGKAGAALMAAMACLRSGAGLLTLHSTAEVIHAMLQQLPEAMSSEDRNSTHISECDHPESYGAVAFGPGTGTSAETEQALKKLLQFYKGKLVIDADGLNLLADNKTLLEFLPPSSILTPHPKEFERLAGKSENDFDRLERVKNFSQRYNCIVILKGAHSVTAMPDGNLFFNSTGNPGMAKGGSGDVLTGILLGLLARGYNAPQSALIGNYLHGLAADLCLKKMSMESVLATDIIKQLPKAFRKLEGK